jgi:tetratricopeptide (TPR) repeat protein
MVSRQFGLALALLVSATAPATAGEAVEAARSLLSAWHEDPARIDRARTLLEAAVAREPEAEALVELAQVWFFIGEFRARAAPERQAAYEHGSETARRAIAVAPQSDGAHFWYAVNTGRLAELRGVMRAVAMVSTVREESATVLRLNPSSVDGLTLAASLDAALPALMGADRARAEARFLRALQIDPHRTGTRLELARLYMTTKRWTDARRELDRVLEEQAATDVPRWTVREVPEARALLAELGARGAPARLPRAPSQAT